MDNKAMEGSRRDTNRNVVQTEWNRFTVIRRPDVVLFHMSE